jgi:hypothetical protein
MPGNGHGEKLSRKQETAIAALLGNPTIKGAAQSIGIGEATLCRWMSDSAFSDAYRDARYQLMKQAIGKMQACISRAVDILMLVAEDTEAPASARVSAARSIIDQALKSAEMEDLVKRVEQLEKKIGAKRR